jgi:UDP-3-O-[3-hydroxymyristoyl] glucosamine N-acyltransferase
MADYTVAELGLRLGGEVVGAGERRVRGVAPLESAGPDQLSLVANKKYISYVPGSSAAAVLVGRELADALPDGVTQIRVGDPHVALREALLLLYPEPDRPAGVHPTAVVDGAAEVGSDVWIGPYAVIGAGARLGDRVRVGAHTVVGDGSTVGADTVLHPHVTLYPGVEVGARCTIHSGARLGRDGFGYVLVDGGHHKVPQVGRCVIEDDVDIGSNCSIDRGSIGDTVVGQGTKIDALVHLGHNVRIGRHSILIAQVGIAGSVTVGDGVVLGGQVGVAGHLSIGAGARLAGQSGVFGDVPAGETYSGFPARPHRETLRAQGAVFKLPDVLRRVRELERRLGQEPEAGPGGEQP